LFITPLDQFNQNNKISSSLSLSNSSLSLTISQSSSSLSLTMHRHSSSLCLTTPLCSNAKRLLALNLRKTSLTNLRKSPFRLACQWKSRKLLKSPRNLILE
jgi:hypothetical protein